ncbi:STM3941 family protein [Actinoplanes derwentensis]
MPVMVVYRSLPKTAGLLLLAFVLVGASGWMISAGGLFQQVVGVVGVLFFGFGVFILGRQLLRREPVIEVNSAGMRDVRLSKQVVPWTVVRGVRQVNLQKQRFVALDLEPTFERGYLAGASRVMQRINQGAGWAGVHVSTSALAVSFDQLYDTILREWQAVALGDDPVGGAGGR